MEPIDRVTNGQTIDQWCKKEEHQEAGDDDGLKDLVALLELIDEVNKGQDGED